MLKREHRLPSSVRLTTAHALRFPAFIIKYQVAETVIARAGVVISKKVSAKATERNRLRRVVQTCLHTFLPTLPIPLDMLVILTPQAASMTNEALATDITASFTKLHR